MLLNSYKCKYCLFYRQMSASKNPNWLVIPDLVFEKIMLEIGLVCLDSLDSCRQVCRAWHVAIMRKLWENPSKSWGDIIRRRIERSWGPGSLPSDQRIVHAKLLGDYM